jgi:hypothetical protein
MAEIKIEKKKPVGPWVLVGLVVLALIVYFGMFHDNDTVEPEEFVTQENNISDINQTNLLDVKENNITVAEFVRFVKSDSIRLSLEHTNKALVKLTEATNAMAVEVGYDVGPYLDTLKESNEMVANERFESAKAKNIRMAAENSAKALENIQLAKYPWLSEEVEDLKSASMAINPDAPVVEQKDAVHDYFAKAADILEKMN